MPSRERRSGALDADGRDDPSPECGEVTSPELPASEAQAEEAAVLAESRAQAARARARQLSEKADAVAGTQHETTDTADGEKIEGAAVADSVTEEEPSPPGLPRFRLRWRPHRPRRKTVAAGVAAALVCGSLGGSGYVLWHHRTVAQERQRAADFAAAARQEAITIMSIDASKARHDVQRIIDNTTGQFRAGILLHADEMVQAVERSKVSTKVAVQGVAVESMTDDSAVVLVTAKADASDPDKKLPPRSWRVIMTLRRDAGQLKVSAVEVLP